MDRHSRSKGRTSSICFLGLSVIWYSVVQALPLTVTVLGQPKSVTLSEDFEHMKILFRTKSVTVAGVSLKPVSL